ncbi:MAG: D-aminopeptidase [Chlamydiia bacterium]|nr:D-aminopeptidase [Chlamydiia bacterium]MCH9618029.1 D-aminopeptidase [Chlamydiia bacterium]MCH9623646.1 D-aminopeptidase [Chlamydiia bacterium]
MRNKFSILFLCLCASLSAENAEINTIVQEYMEKIGIPSVCVSVVTRDGTLHKKAYGYRDLENKIPATTETVYPVGSISKSFTAALFGIHQDEGLLTFDHKIVDLIPFFQLNNQTVTDEITIRDYLSHQSGYGKHDTLWVNKRYSRKELIAKLRHIPEVFPHRKVFAYQNIGYSVAAHALECLTNSTWELLIEQKILRPLKMNHTYLDTLEMQKLDNYAFGYSDHIHPNSRIQFMDPYTIAPAGGLCMNIHDLSRWTQCLLQNRDEIIASHTLEELYSPQIITSFTENKLLNLNNNIQMEAYGLGFFIITYKGKKIIFHPGNIDGFSSLIAFLPEEDLGVSVITNKDQTFSPFFIALAIIEKHLGIEELNGLEIYMDLRKKMKKGIIEGLENAHNNRQEDSIPTHPLGDYTGIYAHPGYGGCEVSLTGTSLKAMYNEMLLPLEHWHYGVFSATSESPIVHCHGVKFNFHSNFDGEVDKLDIIFVAEDGAISFKKQANVKYVDTEYLDRFTGEYSYYGVGISVKREGTHLVAKTAGMPPFHLVSEKNSTFSVDSDTQEYDAYTIHFLDNEDGDIHCVQLIRPGGSVFSAYKK